MNLTFGLLLIVLAGVSQGTMGLGQKRFQPMSWEAYWFLFSILSMIVVPFVWMSLVIPDPYVAITSVKLEDAATAFTMGALWGVGALMWAKALVNIGLSITYGIGMSMSAIIGSLGLLLSKEDPFADPSSKYIVLGVFVLVLGVVLVTLAGVKREKLKGEMPDTKAMTKGTLLITLLFAFVNGFFAGGLNFGFVSVESAAQTAIEQGAASYNASLVQWQFVFWGGLIIQAGYSLALLIKRKSFHTYYKPKGVWKTYLVCLITAFLWFAALGLYGQASAVLGERGPVIGWTMWIAVSLLVSNGLGLLSGEWKGAKVPLKILNYGNAILVISWIILGYANSL